MELRDLVRDLYGIDRPQGCSEEEIAAVKALSGALPQVLEEFWRAFGRTRALNTGPDKWFFPEDFLRRSALARSDHLPLLCENQSVCRAEIRREDLSLPDPPVYTQMGEDGPWRLSAPSLSEFLEAALTYEAAWQLKHGPKEIFWLTGRELAAVQAGLEQRPCVLRNWMDLEITFYSSRPDNLAAVMDAGDHYEVIYGGAARESCAALLEVMDGLGEPI